MKILALDLSTKTGWALILDGKLFQAGRVSVPDPVPGSRPPMILLIERAKAIAQAIAGLVNTYQPNVIVIEETNQPGFGRSRDAQKQLEFIHFTVNDALWDMGKVPAYLATSRWQKFAGVKLTKEERASNKEANLKRQEHKAALRTQIEAEVVAEYMGRLDDCQDRKSKNAVRKQITHEVKSRFKKAVRSIRIEGPSKKTLKHSSVEVCNREFRTQLKAGDHDVADAALLGLGYYRSIKETPKP